MSQSSTAKKYWRSLSELENTTTNFHDPTEY